MNVLLFAPGLLLLLLQSSTNLIETAVCLSICAAIQLILGAPFLTTHPVSYIRKAFEFDRVFFYKWTVNLKFLPEETFVSKRLSLLLLALHLSLLAALALKWLSFARRTTGRRIFLRPNVASSAPPKQPPRLSPEYVAYTMFSSNFVGIAFARTLHYQFYSWYFHSVPFLLWSNAVFPFPVRVVIVGMIEYAFNVFPATPASSVVLQVAHLAILVSAIIGNIPKILEGGKGEGETEGTGKED
eukprot:CAMPEP_0183327710 /NCGR_PEP_ID=MMETSP0160_2-20130417/83906_1 /TAXON_ID=2839 ORGANISM="Odontella Sinensis, Strain Grunow 1884" /NCGR_SAMPLE_ID=MMETSP0160_2 /ASSEMBLY_ACC=CAM_ASM_000250 /LENGTH=241 /DNA_ID=CAMNT_0025495851 /DNA_START=142 /DNA_END=867 /DNA_ORIENTATION=-